MSDLARYVESMGIKPGECCLEQQYPGALPCIKPVGHRGPHVSEDRAWNREARLRLVWSAARPSTDKKEDREP